MEPAVEQGLNDEQVLVARRRRQRGYGRGCGRGGYYDRRQPYYNYYDDGGYY
jgi:hypothetical protein